jgi:hypothetical protein
MQFLRKLEPIQNVLATGHFTLSSKLVLGNVIERIILDFTGSGSLTKAMITNLVVKLNGKVTFGPINAADLDLLQRYLTIVNDALRITIDFTEPVARSIQGQLMGAIDTQAAGVVDFTLEGDITGATTPQIAAYAQLRAPSSLSPARGFDPAVRPLIRALIPTTLAPTATGEFPFDLNYGSRGDSLIKRVVLFSTITTAFRVKRDSLDIYGDTPITTALAGYVQAEYGRDDQLNMYVYDPLVDGNQSDALPTRTVLPDGSAREAVFQWLPTVSATGVIRAFVDAYTTLDRL